MKIQQFLKAAVLVGAGLITASASAVQIGPNPTKSSLEANRGPFNVSQFNVSRPSGYGADPSISRSRPRGWPRACPRVRGGPSPGARARPGR